MTAALRSGFAILALSVAVATSIKAEDWPEFRGPTRQGISTATGLPTVWSTTKNVKWKKDLPGRAWSSPIVIGEVIYVTDAVGRKDSTDPHDTFSLRVMAINALDGATLWDQEIFVVDQPHTQGIHGKNSYASATPIYEDGRIYAHFGHFGTACLDAQGKILWKSNEVKYMPVHGNGGCPILVKDLLIFHADGATNPRVVALSKDTGRLRWQVPRTVNFKKPFSFCTPLLIEVDGKPQIISTGSGVVSALRPEDGREIWKVRHEGYSVIPRPVFAHGLVFACTSYDRSSILAIKPDGQGDVTDTHVVWRMEKGAPHTPSPLVVGDDLYLQADNGLVSCVEARTGTLKWQERVSRQSSASPIYADGKIYLLDEQGSGYVIKPGPRLELLAQNDLGDKALASYAVVGKNLLIRTQHTLWCMGE